MVGRSPALKSARSFASSDPSPGSGCVSEWPFSHSEGGGGGERWRRGVCRVDETGVPHCRTRPEGVGAAWDAVLVLRDEEGWRAGLVFADEVRVGAGAASWRRKSTCPSSSSLACRASTATCASDDGAVVDCQGVRSGLSRIARTSLRRGRSGCNKDLISRLTKMKEREQRARRRRRSNRT